MSSSLKEKSWFWITILSSYSDEFYIFLKFDILTQNIDKNIAQVWTKKDKSALLFLRIWGLKINVTPVISILWINSLQLSKPIFLNLIHKSVLTFWNDQHLCLVM